MANQIAEGLAILEEQIRAPTVDISYGTLFRYATTWDLILLFIGSICAAAGGAALPLMTVSLAFIPPTPSYHIKANTKAPLAPHRHPRQLLPRPIHWRHYLRPSPPRRLALFALLHLSRRQRIRHRRHRHVHVLCRG
jgi:hypothetical protein